MISAIIRREPTPAESSAHRQQAAQLIAYLQECRIAGIERQACIVHLARLPVERTRPHHLRLARAALEPLANADRARVFTLPNRTIVAVWRGRADSAMAASKDALIHLFSDGEEVASTELLWEELEIPNAADRLLLVAEQSTGPKSPHAPSSEGVQTFNPAILQALELRLSRADVARFARRHPVLAMAPDGGFRLAWDRRMLCIKELAESLTPDHAPKSDKWLFLRLTRTLDRRMLALLSAPGELAGAGSFAINLNVASILAASFLRFDEALPSRLRGQVTIDLHPADILADPAAFLFARDFARTRGYRLMLCNVSADLLPVLPPERLGLDLVMLPWSAACTRPGFAAVLPDRAKIVLGDADTAEAVAWGLSVGITLFQGRAVAEQKSKEGHRHATAKP